MQGFSNCQLVSCSPHGIDRKGTDCVFSLYFRILDFRVFSNFSLSLLFMFFVKAPLREHTQSLPSRLKIIIIIKIITILIPKKMECNFHETVSFFFAPKMPRQCPSNALEIATFSISDNNNSLVVFDVPQKKKRENIFPLIYGACMCWCVSLCT